MGSDRVRPFAASILEAALPSLSSPEERIRDMAQRTNNALLELGSSGRLDVAGVLAVAQQAISLGREPTRMAALRRVRPLRSRLCGCSAGLPCLQAVSRPREERSAPRAGGCRCY